MTMQTKYRSSVLFWYKVQFDGTIHYNFLKTKSNIKCGNRRVSVVSRPQKCLPVHVVELVASGASVVRPKSQEWQKS